VDAFPDGFLAEGTKGLMVARNVNVGHEERKS
jgi:hypothetical protein